MDKLSVPAPAKLNLFLHITGRLSNGYHSLQTLFQLIDLQDELEFTVHTSPDITFSCTDETLLNDDNLVLKAARLLKDSAGNKSLGAHVHLIKKLPMGGGIGGGSSDAASALLALNRLWQLDYSIEELAALGLTLGADVPVFVRGHSAWGEGIGEQLTAVPTEPSHFLLIHPPVHVATAQLFAHPELTRDTPISTIQPALAQTGRNDFEPLVRKLYPEIEQAFQDCLNFGTARLTGTGSCLYLPLTTNTVAHDVKAKLSTINPSLRTYVTRGVNVSPAFTKLNYTQ